MPFLYTLMILLTAAIVAVPLARKLGVGSVLGYIAAGLVIGPAGLGLVSDVENIAQVSELGVVMLLFLIGLELRPQRLWTMRRSVFGLGAAQVVLTTAVLTGLIHWSGLGWAASLVLGFALSMSSTAIVLPMLAERELLTTPAGRDGFSVLLFQDLAVIPAVALIPLLNGNIAAAETAGGAWLAVAQGFAALVAVLLGGRFLIRPLFRIVDSARTPEIFTATALVVVIGTALLVSSAGLSMSLGAFLAGVLLSDSEYRHEVRADIEPFEGLLLGVFFLSVGMSVNVALFLAEPLFILGAVFALIAIKAAVCVALALRAGRTKQDAVRFGTALAQAGEFAFVILTVAVANAVLPAADAQRVTLIVSMSMMVSPLLFWLQERFVAPRLAKAEELPYDEISANEDIIICGFGRVGQVIGRVLRMRGIRFTALDKNAEQIALVRRFGNTAYYGDATRLDLLRAAGAAEAKILVIALDDVEASLIVADHARRHFPHLKILARARNRRHVHLLMDRGIANSVRETYYSSLLLSRMVMTQLGIASADAARTAEIFEARDGGMLTEQHGYYEDEKRVIQTSKEVTEELRGLLEADRADAA